MEHHHLGKKTRTYSVDASTEGQALCKENLCRTGFFMYNNGSDTVYVVHDQSIAYTEGIPVGKGDSYENSTTTATLFVKTASGTQNLRCQEDSD